MGKLFYMYTCYLECMRYYYFSYFSYFILLTIYYKSSLNCSRLSLGFKVLSTKVGGNPDELGDILCLFTLLTLTLISLNDGYGVVKTDSHMQHQGHSSTLLSPSSSSLIAVRDSTESTTKVIT